MKLKIILLFSLCITLNAGAQNARAILDKAADTYNRAGGVTATFTLDTKDLKAKQTYSFDGKVLMKGDKFKIETPDGITWFDGKTQWVYLKDSQEVNISTPTGEELQAISPSAMFNIYKSGYNLTYKGEKTVKGKTVQEVEMTPQKKNSDITRIVVQIDKRTNIFSSITISYKSDLQNVLAINTLQTATNLPDATFIFNKKDYPKVEVIDLR